MWTLQYLRIMLVRFHPIFIYLNSKKYRYNINIISLSLFKSITILKISIFNMNTRFKYHYWKNIDIHYWISISLMLCLKALMDIILLWISTKWLVIFRQYTSMHHWNWQIKPFPIIYWNSRSNRYESFFKNLYEDSWTHNFVYNFVWWFRQIPTNWI